MYYDFPTKSLSYCHDVPIFIHYFWWDYVHDFPTMIHHVHDFPIVIWLVVSNHGILFSMSYMGCHPSHWRAHIFQGGRYTTNQKGMFPGEIWKWSENFPKRWNIRRNLAWIYHECMGNNGNHLGFFGCFLGFFGISVAFIEKHEFT